MILVLDFGSQYTQLIARRIRESKVYCEIHPFNLALAKIKALNPEGIVLSGGPASVYQKNAPKVDAGVFNLPVPFFGICYGMGIVNLAFGGEAGRADHREYGPADLTVDIDTDLFCGFSKNELTSVWMSHGDKMTAFPKGWNVLAHSSNSPIRRAASSACSFIPRSRTRRADGRSWTISFFASAAVSPLGRWNILSRPRCRKSAPRWARAGFSARSAVAWIRRWRRPWFTARSKNGWSAFSSITDSCARTKPNKCAAYSSSGLATVFTTSMPASNFLAHCRASKIPKSNANALAIRSSKCLKTKHASLVR